jgi:hypothetical protein
LNLVVSVTISSRLTSTRVSWGSRHSRSGSSSPPPLTVSHGTYPDYFLRTADGGGVVVDIKPDELIGDDDRLNFTGTAVLCQRVGWAYRRLGELPAVCSANLRWLAGYRHERVKGDSVAARAAQFVNCCPGITLGELVHEVGQPPLVVPTIFHMLWHHDLVTDVAERRLSMATAVYPGHRR